MKSFHEAFRLETEPHIYSPSFGSMYEGALGKMSHTLRMMQSSISDYLNHCSELEKNWKDQCKTLKTYIYF